MRVFVTGASGFIGSAVVDELIKAGHQVLGLARSEESAKKLIAAGAEVHRGTLEDVDSLRSGVATTDATMHLGFIHDFSKFKENCETDRRAIRAMGGVLAGTDRPLIITSGTGLLTPDKLGLETDAPGFSADVVPRVASEEAAAEMAAQGINVSVVRLPPSVHGDGDRGFVPALINMAREKGVSAYPGEGANLWPAVHRLDAAAVYRLILEKGAGPGAHYHAVADQGIPVREIAEMIGKKLGIPVVSKSEAERAEHFTWMAHFITMHCPSSSAWTRQQLGWTPTHVGLIEDLENGTYFD